MRALIVSAALLGAAVAQGDPWTDAFTFERVAIPPGIDPQIGGLDTAPSGRLAMCFHRGEVFFYDPADGTWSQFAEGLHEPLGLLVEDDRTLLVMQRCELRVNHYFRFQDFPALAAQFVTKGPNTTDLLAGSLPEDDTRDYMLHTMEDCFQDILKVVTVQDIQQNSASTKKMMAMVEAFIAEQGIADASDIQGQLGIFKRLVKHRTGNS